MHGWVTALESKKGVVGEKTSGQRKLTPCSTVSCIFFSTLAYPCHPHPPLLPAKHSITVGPHSPFHLLFTLLDSTFGMLSTL